MKITKGKIKTALKIVVYGQEGVGKSTFASRFPDPVFIDTEGSTKQLDVARFDLPTSWEMLLSQVEYIIRHPEEAGTLVIDTADWAEKLCIRKVCDKAKKEGIEDFGYGKGYVYVQEEFGKLINKLNEVVNVGINVVITAHAQMKKVEQPDEMGSYDRWELKLTKQCSPMLKEWADLLLFANYKTLVVETGNKKYKGQGGQQRIMYTTHTASWDAKNRFSLPDVLPFDYAQIEQIITTNSLKLKAKSCDGSRSEAPGIERSESEKSVKAQKESSVRQEPERQPAADPLDTFIDEVKEKGVDVEVKTGDDIPSYVPKALADLMEAKCLSVRDIENIVAKRGYFPSGTPFKNYPPDFIDGCLIAAWDQLYSFAIDNGLVDLPF